MIKAALIGLGNIAWRYDARLGENSYALSQAGALLREDGVELAGGSSPCAEDRSGFAAWSGGKPAFDSPADMLSALRPDLVGVCSPSELHFEHAMQCIEAGVKMIWLEKPPTLNADHLRKLLDAAEKTKTTVCVNYFRRYLPQYQKLRDIVRAKTYGEILNIRSTYSPGLARNGVHMLDQLFFLTDSDNFRLLWSETDGDTQSPSLAVRLSSGPLALVSGSSAPYHTNDIHIQFEKASATIAKGGKSCALELRAENLLFPGFYELGESAAFFGASSGLEGYMQNSLKDLLRSHAEGKDPDSNLKTAALSQRLLGEALEKSK